jgi:hypothetical protein
MNKINHIANMIKMVGIICLMASLRLFDVYQSHPAFTSCLMAVTVCIVSLCLIFKSKSIAGSFVKDKED